MSIRTDEAESNQGRRCRSRRISDNEYETYRPRILDLYLKQKRSREEIIEILADEDGLRLSFKQLKHRLQKWSARKNMKRAQGAETRIHNDQTDPTVTDIDTNQWSKQSIRNADGRGPGPPHAGLRTQLDPFGVEAGPYLSHELPSTNGKANGATQRAGQEVRNGPYYDEHLNPVPFSESQPRSTFCHRYTSSKDEAVNTEKPFPTEGTSGSPGSFPKSSDFIGASSHAFEAMLPDFQLDDLHFSFSPLYYAPLPANQAVNFAGTHQLSIQTQPFTPIVVNSPESPQSCQRMSSPGDKLLAFQKSSITSSPDLKVVTSLEDVDLTPGSVDAKVIAHLSLGLNILCAEFQKHGAQWLTPRGIAKKESCFPVLRDALDSEWVQTALEDIISDCLSACKRPTKCEEIPVKDQNAPPPRRSSTESTPDPNQDTSRRARQKEHSSVMETRLNAVTLAARESEYKDMIKLQLRKLSQTLSTGFEQDASTTLTLLSIPPARTRQLAIKFVIQKVLDVALQPRLSRTLTTFNVIPCDSEVIHHIRENNITGVQKLFSTRQAAPSDLDSEGRSLLSYAIEHRRLDIYRLLLENGSSREDVDSGLDVVSAIWGYYVLRDPDGDLLQETKECVTMTRMALGNDSSVSEIPMILGGLSILNKAQRLHSSSTQPTIDFIVGLFRVEHTGPSGRTPLLCACTINSVVTLTTLINMNANVHAVDDQGRGALHSALYRRSYLICPDDCGNSRHEAPHQCECPAGPVPHDCHYIHSWRECPRNNPSGLDQTLLTLLQRGCDPNVRDKYGQTPSDYAKRKPDLWEIWLMVLMMGGYRFDSLDELCYPTDLAFGHL